MEKENEIPYRKLVLDYFEGEIYNEWTPSAEFEVYETTTADGYAIYVAKSQQDEEIISENVFYYDHELPEIVKDAIEKRRTTEQYRETIEKVKAIIAKNKKIKTQNPELKLKF